VTGRPFQLNSTGPGSVDQLARLRAEAHRTAVMLVMACSFMAGRVWLAESSLADHAGGLVGLGVPLDLVEPTASHPVIPGSVTQPSALVAGTG